MRLDVLSDTLRDQRWLLKVSDRVCVTHKACLFHKHQISFCYSWVTFGKEQELFPLSLLDLSDWQIHVLGRDALLLDYQICLLLLDQRLKLSLFLPKGIHCICIGTF